MKKYISIFIIIFTTTSINLFAVAVRNYTISPLNRVTIYFDIMPTHIDDSLTRDKKTLYINLGDVAFTDAQQFVIGEGIIQKAELIKKNKNTFLSLSLSEQRGFTIAKLPYSTGLVVEVFDWNKLDSDEEAYRLGLLSLKDNEIELAEPDLLKGTNAGIGDAAFFLGSIHLSKGKINTALKLFLFADLKKTTINDNYAALSQIYTYKKQNAEAEKYAKIYKTNTGNTNVPVIQFPQIIESGELSDMFPSIDSMLLNAEQILVDSMPDTTQSDTAKVELKDTIPPENDNESIWVSNDYLLTKYVVGIAIALILFVVYLYLKWRNKKLLEFQEAQLNSPQPSNKTSIKPNNNTSFKEVMEEKINESKEHKKQNQDNTKENKEPKKPDENKKNNKQTELINLNKNIQKQIKKTNNDNKKAASTSKIDYNKNAGDLLNYIDKIKEEGIVVKSDSILKSELELSNINANRNKNLNNINRTNTANVDLASRLLSEQKKLKQEKLSNLSTEKLTPEKINEIAKKIGIDKGSLETKQNLDNIMQNEEELKKLKEKFGIKE